jgi:16S rRNA (cytidine1402-2'-O)-methyltransferase
VVAGGRLVLVATPIGNLGDLSPRAVETLAAADVIACEDTRHTRKLLSASGISGRLISVHEHNETAQTPRVLEMLAGGQTVALVSDAGTPAISDPGERLVAAAIEAGHRVDIVPGPSAVIAALALSGLSTARFVFEGFLPRKGAERTRRLADIAREPRTVVVYEAPNRVAGTIGDLVNSCRPDRRVAIAREITKLYEEVWRGPLGEAASHLDKAEARGEHVIVIEGAAPLEATAEDVDAALRSRLDAGESKKEAIAAVASELGVPKRAVYDAALRLS